MITFTRTIENQIPRKQKEPRENEKKKERKKHNFMAITYQEEEEAYQQPIAIKKTSRRPMVQRHRGNS